MHNYKTAFFAFGILLMLATQVKAQPIMSGIPDTIFYGCISKGSDPLRSFTFYNSGNEPLVIMNCKGSTGALTPDWPKEEVLPGDSAQITIKYNTNAVGVFCKYVEITTNETPNNTVHILFVKGTIKQPSSIGQVNVNPISVYPTFCKDGFLFVELSEKMVFEKLHYQIFTSNSRLVQQKTILEQSNIDISALKSGLYYLIFFEKDTGPPLKFRFYKQ